MSLFGCSRTKASPCVTVELIRPDCDAWPLDRYTLYGIPTIDGSNIDGRLSFLSGDIPAEYLDCCTLIRARVSWPEYGLYDYALFDGQLNEEERERILGGSNDNIEWSIIGLWGQLERIVIAWPVGSPQAFKSADAATVYYEYLTENMVTTIGRGDGSACAERQTECLEIVPPTAEQIANAPAWEGDRAGAELLKTIQNIASIGGWDLQAEIITTDDPCCYVCRYSLGETGEDRTAILSPCLENVAITSVKRSCEQIHVVHVFGKIDDGGGGTIETIVTRCIDGIDGIPVKCRNEESLKIDDDVTTVAAMETAGDELLQNQPPNELLTFDIIWTCSLKPIVDLAVGDTFTLQDEDENERLVRVIRTPFLAVDDELVEYGAVFEVLNG